MINLNGVDRRRFLKATALGGAAAMAMGRFNSRVLAAGQAPATPAPSATQIAVTNGDDRADLAMRGLSALKQQIADAIGNRRVIIKPNNVSTNNPLSATAAENLEGILEFLKSIGKLEGAIIAESSTGNTMQGFSNYGYPAVATKYGAKLVDLDQEKYSVVLAFSQADVRPHPVRVASMLLDHKDNYVISAAKLKTHNYAVVTLSLKNIVLGAPLKLGRAGTSTRGRGGGRGMGMGGSDKPLLHGDGAYGINLNLAMLAPLLHPDLAVIDGYQGMQGNGPISGTPVEHRVCVVGTDWLAADRVGAALMGVDMANVGYLTYLADSGMGETDLAKIEILGEPIETLRKEYQLGSSIASQLQWQTPGQITPRTGDATGAGTGGGFGGGFGGRRGGA